MLVRIQPSALFARSRPDGVADGIGLSEGPGPGSTPGRDTQKSPASVLDSTAVFETARRGSIPRRGINVLGVWRIAYDPAKVGDQVRLLTRMLMTLELDGQATGCNPVEVGSIPTGVSDDQLPARTTS